MRAKNIVFKAAIGFLGLLLLWLPITWFFFGSVHPCGVLKARMQPMNQAHAMLKNVMELGLGALVSKRGGRPSPPRSIQSIIADSERELDRLTPAQCLWRAMTWRWDPNADEGYQMLNRIVEDINRSISNP